MPHQTSRSSRKTPPASKSCAICGRTMTYRPRWANTWHAVKTCSAACKKIKLGAHDKALEQAILSLLGARKEGATICPSEASRAVLGDQGLTADAMQRTRYAANRLVAEGLLQVTQKGRVIEPSSAKGPVRLRLPLGQ